MLIRLDSAREPWQSCEPTLTHTGIARTKDVKVELCCPPQTVGRSFAPPKARLIRSANPRGIADQDWKIWGLSLVFARHGDASV